MGDPTRMLHVDSDADALERSLLESLSRMGPSDELKGAMWQELAASALAAGALVAAAPTLAGGGAASMASGGAAAASAVGTKVSLGGLGALVPKALLGKLVLAGALTASSVGGYAAWQTQHVAAPRMSTAPSAAPTHKQARRVEPQAAVAVPNETFELAPAPVVPSAATPDQSAAFPARAAQHVRHARPQSERLLRESKLLTEARAALRRADLTRTDALLRQLHTQFPRGGLLQEREVLQVETTFAHGDKLGARERAARFVARHPESPHNLTLRRFLSPP